MGSGIAFAFGFGVMVLLRCVTAQTVYIVGDNLGWDVPRDGAQAYTTWASGKNFMVGDILTFNFMTNSHDVLRVQKSSFDACTQANPIGDIITTGPVNITLQAPGEHYYICTIAVGRHCQGGQKLSITVSGTGTPGGAPSPTTTPTSPSPSSNNTPPGAECPTESPTSTPTGPTQTGTPATAPPPPNSSSSKVLGSIFVSLVAAALALGF